MVLSSLGKQLTCVAIISDCSWPSWVLVLELFLESSLAFKKAIVLTPCRSCHNFFGTSRQAQVVWKSFNLNNEPSPSASLRLCSILAPSKLHLYSGSLVGFCHFIVGITSSGEPSVPILCLIHGTSRLRSLSRFSDFTWRNITHSSVGGASSGKFWIGFNRSFRSLDILPPRPCPLSMADLLEFAPKHVHVDAVPAPPDHDLIRSSSLISVPGYVNTWLCSGLYPFHCLHDPSVRVLAPSPFVRTKWAVLGFTTKEIARFLDAPVAVKVRLARAFPTVLPIKHDFRSSFPGKILTHALWSAGFCMFRDGGLDLFRPKFKLDASSGNLISQSQFNRTTTSVDVKAAKMDDAAVPVQLWNDRLIDTHPCPDHVKSVSKPKLFSYLDVIRSFLLRIWMRKLLKSLINYLKITYSDVNNSDEYSKDLEAGLDCISYATKCNWWEWLGGSRLFFWRWPPEFRKYARDGIPVCWLPNKQPTSKRPQPPVHDKEIKSHMTSKLQKVRKKAM